MVYFIPFKLWAKSLSQAKLFYAMKADVRNQGHKGILVGCLHNIYDLSQATRRKLAECCASELCEVGEDGHYCRSFWLPEHGYNGLLYREGENVIVIVPDDGEIVTSIETIYKVPVLGQRRAFIRGKKFEWDGHSVNSEHRKVKETQDRIFAELDNVSRKVMLLELTTDPGSFLVIDFMRRIFPIAPGTVVLPYYPVVNDMVMVRGATVHDIWRARVISFDLPRKFILGRFFTKEDEIWIPERGSQNQRIFFASILGIANGNWLRDFDRWQDY